MTPDRPRPSALDAAVSDLLGTALGGFGNQLNLWGGDGMGLGRFAVGWGEMGWDGDGWGRMGMDGVG